MDYDNPEENGTENPVETSAYGLLTDLSTSRSFVQKTLFE